MPELPPAYLPPPPFMEQPEMNEPPEYHKRFLLRMESKFVRARNGCIRCLICSKRRCSSFQLMWPGLVVIGLMAIIFGIFFGVVYPTVLSRQYFELSTCTSLRLAAITSRCCAVADCSCSECSTLNISPNCGSLVQQPLNNSICCGGSACCASACDTCASTSCSGTGSSRSCSTSYYTCNCHCVSSVAHMTCSFVCGTCTSFDLFYRVQATSLSQHRFDFSCGLNDDRCVFRMNQQY